MMICKCQLKTAIVGAVALIMFLSGLSGICLADQVSIKRITAKPVPPSLDGFSTKAIIESGNRGGMLVPHGTNFTTAYNREMGEAIEIWNDHRWPEGNEIFKRMYKEHPDSPWAAEAELHVAAFARLNGDFKEAENRFLSVLEKHGDSEGVRQRVLLHLPQLYWETARPRAALASLNQILDGELTWTKKQFYENFARIFQNAIFMEDQDRRCGAVAVALALEAGSRSATGETPLMNISMEAIGARHPWSLVESKHPDGYSLSELATISGGKPRVIDYETLKKTAKPGRPIVACLEPPPESNYFERLKKGRPKDYKRPPGHFVVVESATDRIVTILDPRVGRIRYEVNRFNFVWTGKVLMLPSQDTELGQEMPENLASASRGGCCGSPSPASSNDCLDEDQQNGKDLQKYCTNVKGVGAARNGHTIGAPSYQFGLPNKNLQVSDIPIWYPSARGPDMAVRLDHNRTDSRNGADYTNVNYLCFGNKWSFNFSSFMREAPSSNQTVTLPMGRHEEYYKTNTGAYIAKSARNMNTFCVTNGFGKLALDVDDSSFWFSTNNEMLTKFEDRYGNDVTCSYTTNGLQLTNTVDSSGRFFAYTYNAQGCVTNVADILGRNSRFSYSNGNLVSMTDMGGYTTALSYDTNNWITNIVYPDSSGVRFEYTSAGQLGHPYDAYPGSNYAFRIRAIDSLNRTNEYFYHSFSSMGPVTVTDPAGNSWLYGHDGVEPYTYITSDSVNAAPYATYTYLRRGDQWVRRVYDANGINMVEAHYATSAVENVLGFCSSGAYTTTHISRYFAYDTNDWITSEILKTNGVTVGTWSNQYDNAGNLIWTRDALSNVTTIAYNSKNDPVVITNALSNGTWMSYNTDGTMSGLTNSRLAAVRWNYDSRGFNTNVVFPDNTTNTMAYDAAGRMLTFKDAAGLIVSNQYDNLDRTTNVQFSSDMTTVKYAYSFSGVTNITDRLGNQTLIGRDAVGRVSAVTNALTNVVAFTYGLNDELSQILVDMGGYTNRTKFNYTSANGSTRLTSRVMPSGKTNNVYSYTFRGWLAKRTDGFGRDTVYAQDPLGRLSHTDYGGGTNVDLSYDILGNVTKMAYQSGTNAAGTNVFANNAINMLTNATITIAPILGFNSGSIVYRLAYTYDNVGNLTNMVLVGVNGFTNVINTAYSFDSMNRLTMVSNTAATATYQMDAAGRLASKTYGNGDVTRCAYNIESRLSSLVTSNSTTNVQSWYYGYNAMGLITNITNSASSWGYKYDSIYQLTNEFSGTTNISTWSYDKVGNRTVSSNLTTRTYYTCDDDNQLTSYSSATSDWISVTGTNLPGPSSNKWYNTWASLNGRSTRVNTTNGTWRLDWVPVVKGTNTLTVSMRDVSGNVATQSVTFTKTNIVAGRFITWDPNGNPTNILSGTNKLVLSYDIENRLTQVTSNGISILQNYYDGAGKRVAKMEVVSGVTNKYLYVYSGWTVLAVLNGTNSQPLEIYTRGAGIGGDIGSIVAVTHYAGSFTNGTFYYHNNHRGDITTVRLGTNSVAKYDYKAYGELRSSSGVYSSRYRFSSKEYDASMGIYYYGFRFYRPETGTWLTQDPLKEDGGLNQFKFAGNDPICMIDQSGLDAVFLVGRNAMHPDSPTYFTDKAENWAWWYDHTHWGKAHIIQVRNVDDVQKALQIQNIDQLYYFGHASSGSLYLSDESLTKNDVECLDTRNVKPGAKIALFGCHTAQGGGIAQSFANHFGTGVLGSTGGLSFGYPGYDLINRDGSEWFRALKSWARPSGGKLVTVQPQ